MLSSHTPSDDTFVENEKLIMLVHERPSHDKNCQDLLWKQVDDFPWDIR